jgi:CRP/FNR family cyclic AMP-dependent transcriptional regulator
VSDIVELLRKVPLFSGLDREDLATLASIVTRKEFGKRETLFHQGDPGDEFMILTEGSVKVELMNSEGKELTLTILTPFQFLGELALLDDVPRSATVVSMEQSVLLSVNKRDFARILETYPRMSIPMLRQLTRRVRVLTDDIASMAFLDSYSRVTRKILNLAEEMGVPNAEGHILIDRALTHQQLANLVGTTRETVTKILNEMKDNGLLDIRRHRITILDRDELLARADLSGIM